jgi:GntR family transcriptional regulator/MocR family aminotransferase
MYGIIIRHGQGVSQYRQLYEQLREKIINGGIPVAAKLASSRRLSREFGISRAIVLEVMEQLKIEGYLETRHGSGTYITPGLHHEAGLGGKQGSGIPQPPAQEGAGRVDGGGLRPAADRALESSQETNGVFPSPATARFNFISGLPDFNLFPRRAWSMAYRRAIEYADEHAFSYGSPQGVLELRKELAGFLFRGKGIRTGPENIFVTTGAAQGIALMAAVMRTKDGPDIVIAEDPVISFVPDIFSDFSYTIRYAEVDEEGIIPQSISSENARLVFVSPSHQFPLGGTLSAARRIHLLHKVPQKDCYILEDDYDGEFRYGSNPIAPLQVIAPERVVYIGTFSKNLAPALRLGYMVVPEELVGPLKDLKSRGDRWTEGLGQSAMARFIGDGHLERHILRMRKVYAKRNRIILDLLRRAFGNDLRISGASTGLHMVLRFTEMVFTERTTTDLLDKGLYIEPVAAYCMKSEAHRDKLILGYGRIKEEQLAAAVRILKTYIYSMTAA